MTYKNNLKKTALAVAVAQSMAASALAQTESEQDEKTLEVVEVTAAKRVQNLQEVPLAVTSVSGDQLIELGIDDILSLEKAVPGLTLASYGNNPQAIMRGAGSAGTSDIAVPIYIDNMYRPVYGQALAAYIDVERVETLRGPQGTLFGRNTFGGLINVITKKPDTQEFDYGTAVTMGDYGQQKIEGFVNVPLTDKIAMRVTAADEKRDPYVENVFNSSAGLKDADYTYARAQFLFEPTDDLSVNITASTWKDTANGNGNWAYKPLGIPLDKDDYTRFNGFDGWLDPRQGVYIGCADGDRAGGRDWAGNVCAGDESASIIDDPYKIAYSFKPLRELEEQSFTANVNWDVAGHNVNFNAAMFDYSAINLSDSDLSSMQTNFDGSASKSKSQQADLTVTSTGEGPLHYTVGAYYFDNQDNSEWAYLYASQAESWSGYQGATPQTPSWAYWLSEGNGGTKSTAVYGQAEYDLTEKLSMTAGVRYTEDDRISYGSGSLGWGGPGERLFNLNNVTNELPAFDYSNATVDKGVDKHTDWRLGADYQVNDDLMVYGYAATSYIAGSINTLTNELTDPQENTTVEVGFKSTLLDGSLRLNGAFYHADYEGFTTTVFVTRGDGLILATQVPGGGIIGKGAEFEGFWDISENLVLDFGISLDMSEYNEFAVASRLGNDGVDYVDEGGQGWFDVDGENTPYSPDYTISMGLSYEYDLGDMGTLTPHIYAYHNSGYQSARDPLFFAQQPSYTTLDLSMRWQSADGNYNVKAFVNNATDELIMTYTEVMSRGRAAADYKAPRHWGVRASYNF
ncbi:TonB-dependent receptor [Biformimicrobium ophioploci]|uniref:TonB-dependent receptor n=1 Tax=Biformimicrobium ophioploci TaxID=3036711 RepID=A0ABQ6M0S3_9GAMM|nr:TonB-dependent receptor [Microbulbifer sp. NKW57]GMG87945.1 TonB-dependent receptor [Microbulbifer sp. NKW57]